MKRTSIQLKDLLSALRSARKEMGYNATIWAEDITDPPRLLRIKDIEMGNRGNEKGIILRLEEITDD